MLVWLGLGFEWVRVFESPLDKSQEQAEGGRGGGGWTAAGWKRRSVVASKLQSRQPRFERGAPCSSCPTLLPQNPRLFEQLWDQSPKPLAVLKGQCSGPRRPQGTRRLRVQGGGIREPQQTPSIKRGGVLEPCLSLTGSAKFRCGRVMGSGSMGVEGSGFGTGAYVGLGAR